MDNVAFQNMLLMSWSLVAVPACTTRCLEWRLSILISNWRSRPIQHMSQYLLCVFEPLSHISIFGIKGSGKRVLTLISFSIKVSDQLLFAWENNHGFVGEIHLDNFITQPKHYGMPGFHPFLHITNSSFFPRGVRWRSRVTSLVLCQVISKVCEQCCFLVELSVFWAIRYWESRDGVILLSWFSLDIVNDSSTWIQNHFSRVVEIYSCGTVR